MRKVRCDLPPETASPAPPTASDAPGRLAGPAPPPASGSPASSRRRRAPPFSPLPCLFPIRICTGRLEQLDHSSPRCPFPPTRPTSTSSSSPLFPVHCAIPSAMEEYLENMKSLRSYMNDLEEDATKRSAEEQQQHTAIDAHYADIALVRVQAKQASEEVEQLATAKAQVCVEMLEKQGRIATLNVECATLRQTLELLHQEIASISAKLNEKRLFYTKTTETLTVKLQEQQEWLGSLKNSSATMEPHVATSQCKQTLVEGEGHGTFKSEGSLDQLGSYVGNKHRELYTQLEVAKLKIEDINSERSTLLSEISKVKQILEEEKNIFAGFPAALQQMDMKSLEEEYKALQGDKDGEIEYFHSLEETISGMKGISEPVKCCCGLEYEVELGGKTMDLS